jgi:hypothetical protein
MWLPGSSPARPPSSDSVVVERVAERVEFDAQGLPVTVSRRSPITNAGGRASFVLHLDSADFQGQNSLQISHSSAGLEGFRSHAYQRVLPSALLRLLRRVLGA